MPDETRPASMNWTDMPPSDPVMGGREPGPSRRNLAIKAFWEAAEKAGIREDEVGRFAAKPAMAGTIGVDSTSPETREEWKPQEPNYDDQIKVHFQDSEELRLAREANPDLLAEDIRLIEELTPDGKYDQLTGDELKQALEMAKRGKEITIAQPGFVERTIQRAITGWDKYKPVENAAEYLRLLSEVKGPEAFEEVERQGALYYKQAQASKLTPLGKAYVEFYNEALRNGEKTPANVAAQRLMEDIGTMRDIADKWAKRIHDVETLGGSLAWSEITGRGAVGTAMSGFGTGVWRAPVRLIDTAYLVGLRMAEGTPRAAIQLQLDVARGLGADVAGEAYYPTQSALVAESLKRLRKAEYSEAFPKDKLTGRIAEGLQEMGEQSLTQAGNMMLLRAVSGSHYAKALPNQWTASTAHFSKATAIQSLKFATASAIKMEGDWDDRTGAFLTGFAYPFTPAISREIGRAAGALWPVGLGVPKAAAILADVGLNMGITEFMSPEGYSDAWKRGLDEALENGDPDNAFWYAMVNLIQLVPMDGAPSLSTVPRLSAREQKFREFVAGKPKAAYKEWLGRDQLVQIGAKTKDLNVPNDPLPLRKPLVPFDRQGKAKASQAEFDRRNAAAFRLLNEDAVKEVEDFFSKVVDPVTRDKMPYEVVLHGMPKVPDPRTEDGKSIYRQHGVGDLIDGVIRGDIDPLVAKMWLEGVKDDDGNLTGFRLHFATDAMENVYWDARKMEYGADGQVELASGALPILGVGKAGLAQSLPGEAARIAAEESAHLFQRLGLLKELSGEFGADVVARWAVGSGELTMDKVLTMEATARAFGAENLSRAVDVMYPTMQRGLAPGNDGVAKAVADGVTGEGVRVAGVVDHQRNPPAKGQFVSRGIFIEVAPNPDSQEAVDAWNKLSWLERVEATRKIGDEVMPKVALEVFGEERVNMVVEHTTGAYGTPEGGGKVNPSMTVKFPDGLPREKLLAFGKAAGEAMRQKEVIVFDQTDKGAKGALYFAGFSFSRPMTSAEESAFYSKLYSEDDRFGGYARDGEKFIFGNFTVFGDSPMPNEKFLETAFGLLEKYLPGDIFIKEAVDDSFYSEPIPTATRTEGKAREKATEGEKAGAGRADVREREGGGLHPGASATESPGEAYDRGFLEATGYAPAGATSSGVAYARAPDVEPKPAAGAVKKVSAEAQSVIDSALAFGARMPGEELISALTNNEQGVVELGRILELVKSPDAKKAKHAKQWVASVASRIRGSKYTKGSEELWPVAYMLATQKEKDAKRTTDAQLVGLVIERMRRNNEFVYAKAVESYGPELVARMKQWYVGANRSVETLAKAYNVSMPNAVSVCANLSPQNEWPNNFYLTDKLMFFLSQKERVFNDKLQKYLVEQRKAILGKDSDIKGDDPVFSRLAEMSLEDLSAEQKAVVFRAWEESLPSANRGVPIFNPEGEYVGVKVNQDGVTWSSPKPTSYHTLRSAIKAFNAEDAEALEAALPDSAHKVRSFHINILFPERADVATCDTHHAAGTLMIPMASDDAPVADMFARPKGKPIGIAGTYPLFQTALMQATKNLKVLPREGQSVTWDTMRTAFDGIKRGGQKAEYLSAWMDFHEGKMTFEETQDRIWDMVLAGNGGTLPLPDWRNMEIANQRNKKLAAEYPTMKDFPLDLHLAPYVETDYSAERISKAKERFGNKVAPNGNYIWQNFLRWNKGNDLNLTKEVAYDDRVEMVPVETGFHGTSTIGGKRFTVFDPTSGSKRLVNPLRDKVRRPSFISSMYDFGHEFAQMHEEIAGGRGIVYELFARADKCFDYHRASDIAAYESYLMEQGWDAASSRMAMANVRRGSWTFIEGVEFQEFLKEKGYDAFTVYENGTKNWAVYDSSQLKDAEHNNGNFDPRDNDIDHALSRPFGRGDREYLDLIERAYAKGSKRVSGRFKDEMGYDVSDREGYLNEAKARLRDIAKNNGFRAVTVYHGTGKHGFRVIDFDKLDPFALFGPGFYTTLDWTIAQSYTGKEKGGRKGVYELFVKADKPLDMDAKADMNLWRVMLANAKAEFPEMPKDAFDLKKLNDNGLVYNWITSKFDMAKGEASREIRDFIRNELVRLGYDSITHVGGQLSGGKEHRVWIGIKGPSQFKSAEAITYDERGNIIPPSQRFDVSKDDMNYNLAPMRQYDAAGLERIANKPGIDPNVPWSVLKVWRDAKGFVHRGEPGGKLGDIRASMTPEHRAVESPQLTAKRELGWDVPVGTESTRMVNPMLAGQTAGSFSIDRALMQADAIAGAQDATWKNQPYISKLRAMGFAADGSAMAQNKTGTSLYFDIIDGAGQRYRLRIAEHKTTPGTEKYHPYDVDIVVPKESWGDSKAIAGHLGEDLIRQVTAIRAERFAQQMSSDLDRMAPKAGKTIVNHLREGLLGERSRDPIETPLTALRWWYRGLNMPPQHLLRLLEGMGEDLFDLNQMGGLSWIWRGSHEALGVQYDVARMVASVKTDAMPKEMKARWTSTKAKDMNVYAVGTQKLTLSDAEKVFLYVSSKDKDARRHMTAKPGGVLTMAELKTGTPVVLNEAFLKQIAAEVEGNVFHRDIATKLEGIIAEFAPMVNATSMALMGREIAVRQQHFPIQVAADRTNFDHDAIFRPEDMAGIARSLDVQHQIGQLAARGQSAMGPIVLSDPITSVNRYASQVGRYVAWAQFINNAQAVMATGTMKGALSARYDRTSQDVIKDYLDQLAYGGRPREESRTTAALNKTFNELTNRFVSAKLKFNAVVGAMQTVSYLNAAPYIPAPHFRVGAMSFDLPSIEHMGKHNSHLWARFNVEQAAMAEVLDKQFGRSGIGWELIQRGDWLAISKIWVACRSWAKADNPGMDARQIEVEAGRRTALITSMSQPSMSPVDQAAMARSRNPAMRAMFSIFSSQRNQNYGNAVLHESRIWNRLVSGEYRNNPAKVMQDAQLILATRIVPWFAIAVFQTIRNESTLAFLAALGIYRRDDENDEEFGQKVMQNFAYNFLSDRGMIVSKLSSEVRGYDQLAGVMGVIPSMKRVANAFADYHAMEGETYKKDSKYGRAGESKGDVLMRRLMWEAAKTTDNVVGSGVLNLIKDTTALVTLGSEEEKKAGVKPSF
jgi:hypothetical protein